MELTIVVIISIIVFLVLAGLASDQRADDRDVTRIFANGEVTLRGTTVDWMDAIAGSVDHYATRSEALAAFKARCRDEERLDSVIAAGEWVA